MAQTFKEALEALVNARIEAGEDPMDVFDELHREANAVFACFDLPKGPSRIEGGA